MAIKTQTANTVYKIVLCFLCPVSLLSLELSSVCLGLLKSKSLITSNDSETESSLDKLGKFGSFSCNSFSTDLTN